ncbi:MAG: hypothetical protein HY830_00270 [Actinobacteria bacterium]|nr:hypothetical protein [Actinomycetota bacterium]
MARRVLGLALTAAGASAVLGLGLGLAAGPASAAPTASAVGIDAALMADGTGEPTGSADDPSVPGAKGGRLMLRLQRACDRIPNLLVRSERLEDRLAADASTRGSIAHLEARIAKAEAAGDTERVTLLKNRLKVREDLQQLLPGRIDQLKQAQSGLCVDVAAVTGSK